MSEGASLSNFETTKLNQGREHPSVFANGNSTQATGLRNFLKVSDTRSSNTPKEHLPRAPKDVAMVHPSRLRHIGAPATTTALGPSNATTPSRSSNGQNGNNAFRAPVPSDAAFQQVSRSPPRAPKAMTPQVPPTGPKSQATPKSAAKGVNQMPLGIKSPPTGPKAHQTATPRRSSKGGSNQSVAAASPGASRSNSRNKAKKKKFIPLREKLGGSASASSIKKNHRHSDMMRGLKSSPLKLHAREHIPDIPVNEYTNQFGRQQTPNGKIPSHQNSFRPSPKRAHEAFDSPRGPRANGTAINSHKAPVKISHGAKRLAKGSNSTPFEIHRRDKNGNGQVLTQSLPAADTGSGHRRQEAFSHDYRGIPTGPRFPEGSSSRAINEIDPRERGYNFNSSPHHGSDARYMHSPPKQPNAYNTSKTSQTWSPENMSRYEQGEIFGTRMGEMSPRNQSRFIPERPGYRAGRPNEGVERQVDHMIRGRRSSVGYGFMGMDASMNQRPIAQQEDMGPRAGVSNRGKPPSGRFQGRKKAYRNGTSAARGVPPGGARGRGKLMRKGNNQDRAASRAGRIPGSSSGVFKRNSRAVGTSGGVRHLSDPRRRGDTRMTGNEARYWDNGGEDRDPSCIAIGGNNDNKGGVQLPLDKEKLQENGQMQERREQVDPRGMRDPRSSRDQNAQKLQTPQEIRSMQVHEDRGQEDVNMTDGPQVITIDDDVQDEDDIEVDVGSDDENGDESESESQVEEPLESGELGDPDEDIEGEIDDEIDDEELGEEVDGEVDEQEEEEENVSYGNNNEANDVVGGKAKTGSENLEMGGTFDGAVDRSCHGLAGIESQAPPQAHPQIPDASPGGQVGAVNKNRCQEETRENLEPVSSESFDGREERWELPPYHHSPGRPTVPMRLFDFVIIERLEQVALSDIFYSLCVLEESIPHKVSVTAFNDTLVRSYLKVRDMMMRDPLLDVDHETCEKIAKGELNTLLLVLTYNILEIGEERQRL
ncbi:uncharacterized protein LAJ45_06505 [Morchella importuna]|uniref:uncharacterized protein n=1 Tax=Morchella importuna TaxID=1174673 RepID=UPI001E8DB7DC|nr:uncharacterized protein LAJ45_06505 [Morchella importuna]KAH8149426.1 hypothetical protein LAJ45_06505 [Morchella importuna]